MPRRHRAHLALHTLHRHDPLPTIQNRKPQYNLQTRHTNRHDNQENDDPRNPRHLLIADAVGQNLAQVQEHLAALVKDLDARLDLEVFADGGVEWVEGGF